MMPKFSILNPKFTMTVPENQMKAGIYDIMNHIMEQYFSDFDDNTSDYLAEGLMRSVIISIKNILLFCNSSRTHLVTISKTIDDFYIYYAKC